MISHHSIDEEIARKHYVCKVCVSIIVLVIVGANITSIVAGGVAPRYCCCCTAKSQRKYSKVLDLL